MDPDHVHPFTLLSDTGEAASWLLYIEAPHQVTIIVDYEEAKPDEAQALANEIVNVMNHHFCVKAGGRCA